MQDTKLKWKNYCKILPANKKAFFTCRRLSSHIQKLWEVTLRASSSFSEDNDRKEEIKSNSFNKQKQKLWTCITLLADSFTFIRRLKYIVKLDRNGQIVTLISKIVVSFIAIVATSINERISLIMSYILPTGKQQQSCNWTMT